MEKTVFQIPQMDCPSEENLIRLRLDGIAEIKHLAFDIPQRRLTVHHEGRLNEIESSIGDLNLGGTRVSTERSEEAQFEEPTKQRRLLWTVLAINFGFFAIEITTGLISGSMGLIADSLDMLADAFVYGISLFAIGRASGWKRLAALWSAALLLVFGLGVAFDALRRFFTGSEPIGITMITMAAIAAAVNLVCLFLLRRLQSDDVNLEAAETFSLNDFASNGGVLIAGALVLWLDQRWPDLLVGAAVAAIAIKGSADIWRSSQHEQTAEQTSRLSPSQQSSRDGDV